jgi:hypothetical protein
MMTATGLKLPAPLNFFEFGPSQTRHFIASTLDRTDTCLRALKNIGLTASFRAKPPGRQGARTLRMVMYETMRV